MMSYWTFDSEGDPRRTFFIASGNWPDGTTQADHNYAFADDEDERDDSCGHCGAAAGNACEPECGLPDPEEHRADEEYELWGERNE